MKKFKEFLLLFVPLILTMVLPVVIFVSNKSQSEITFISNGQYLRLLLSDSIFWKAILSAYFKAIAFSSAMVIGAALLCRFVKYVKSRKVFYPICTALTSAVSLLSLATEKSYFFSLPMSVYDPHSLVSGATLVFSFSIYKVLMALQIGFFIALLLWIIENVVAFIKSKKSTQK